MSKSITITYYKRIKVYLGFNVVDISSLTINWSLMLLIWISSYFLHYLELSDIIINSILYVLEQTAFIEFITKSLYLFSKISWVKEFGTLIFIVLEDIEIGSQLLIQVLKLTSVSSLFIIFRVFSHNIFKISIHSYILQYFNKKIL